MKTTKNTSKWNIINSPVKMIAGLAVGAMLMTAIALPSNASADVPAKPFTSVVQLIIQAEIDDAAYFSADLTAEQQLVIQAEIDDGFGLEVRAKETNGTPFPAEEQLLIQAEMEDGFVGSVGYSGKQVDRSSSGTPGSVLQALLTHDAGSVFSAEQWLVILAEIEDDSV